MTLHLCFLDEMFRRGPLPTLDAHRPITFGLRTSGLSEHYSESDCIWRSYTCKYIFITPNHSSSCQHTWSTSAYFLVQQCQATFDRAVSQGFKNRMLYLGKQVISINLLWSPTHKNINVFQPLITYIRFVRTLGLPGAMAERNGWWVSTSRGSLCY